MRKTRRAREREREIRNTRKINNITGEYIHATLYRSTRKSVSLFLSSARRWISFLRRDYFYRGELGAALASAHPRSLFRAQTAGDHVFPETQRLFGVARHLSRDAKLWRCRTPLNIATRQRYASVTFLHHRKFELWSTRREAEIKREVRSSWNNILNDFPRLETIFYFPRSFSSCGSTRVWSSTAFLGCTVELFLTVTTLRGTHESPRGAHEHDMG